MGSQVRSGYADTPLGQVHYQEAGSGPPVILFHESPVSGMLYRASLLFLGRRVLAIAPDTPGYGASDPPPELISIAGYGERLALFLDALGLEQVALVGNHTGGAIAIQLAVDLPQRVKALIVVGCPLYTEEERRYWLEEHLKPLPLAADGSHLTRVWRRYQRTSGPDTPLEYVHLAAIEFLRTVDRYDWAYRAVFQFEADRLLPRVSCPTLFLVTDGDGLRDKNERAVALTPGAEGRVIDSHHEQFPARDPEGFSDEVLAYLERVGYLM